jgi:RNA polymerase sigma-70 factor (ECF subfamily)
LEERDEELALRVQQGNGDDLIALVERHYDRLMGYLYRLTGGQRDLAEDMAQETFLRVLRGIGGYQYPRPFKPWLYAIATNIGRNHYRRADTRRMEDELEEVAQVDLAPLPEDSALANEAAQQVLAALSALPDHQREVVVLFYYQEFSQAEIAAALDIPVGTVKSRLSIGLRRLRAMMEQVES